MDDIESNDNQADLDRKRVARGISFLLISALIALAIAVVAGGLAGLKVYFIIVSGLTALMLIFFALYQFLSIGMK